MAGLALALLVEGLLILVVLTLGSSITRHEEKRPVTTIALKASPEARQARVEEQSRAPDVRPARPSSRTAPAVQRDTAIVAPPAQQLPALIAISPKEMASADIANLPRRPSAQPPAARSQMGPADTGGAAAYADTPRVGSAPNGEPLYAAAWYREPYKGELDGYLSTASGPGWGLIACRTASGYRVEDCVALDEYPAGSQIARAVVAAAWQFRVRPPRVGGREKVGDWVRIRIDYGIQRRPAY